MVHRTRAWITLRCEYRRGTSLCISRALLVLIFAVAVFSGCGTVPDVSALIHDRLLYRNDPQFVGPHGPLTAKQAQTIIARLQEHQQTPTDILERHLAFEQSLSAVPLVLGNKVTLLRNGTATYQAMLAAIHGASDNINLEMYTFTDGPIGKMFADAFIDRQQHGVQVNLMYDSLVLWQRRRPSSTACARMGSWCYSTGRSIRSRRNSRGLSAIAITARCSWSMAALPSPAASTFRRTMPADRAAAKPRRRQKIGATPISRSRVRWWRSSSGSSSMSGTIRRGRPSSRATIFQSWINKEPRSCE